MKVQTGDLKWKEVFLKPAGDTLPVGSITEFGGSIIPTNWLKCDGKEVSRASYPQLFKVIGTTYGEGDGSTTFNLPTMENENAIVIIKAKNSLGAAANVVETVESDYYDDVPNAKAVRDYVKEHGLIVSPTEPTTGEEVWIKKGKNLLKLEPQTTTLNGVTMTVNSDGSIILNGTATANTSMLFSSPAFYGVGDYAFGVTTDITEYKPYSLEIGGYVRNVDGSYKYNLSSAHPTRTLLGGEYVNYFNVFFSSGATFNNFTIYPQLEQGTTPTSFEPYIDKEIYVKNDNGVYEEFYNETNLENYSTAEQRIGTWIDGKPLYRKVISSTTANGVQTLKTLGQLSNVKEVTSFKAVWTVGGIAYYVALEAESPIIFVNSDGSVNESHKASYFNNAKVTVIVEYTKSDTSTASIDETE